MHIVWFSQSISPWSSPMELLMTNNKWKGYCWWGSSTVTHYEDSLPWYCPCFSSREIHYQSECSSSRHLDDHLQAEFDCSSILCLNFRKCSLGKAVRSSSSPTLMIQMLCLSFWQIYHSWSQSYALTHSAYSSYHYLSDLCHPLFHFQDMVGCLCSASLKILVMVPNAHFAVGEVCHFCWRLLGRFRPYLFMLLLSNIWQRFP